MQVLKCLFALSVKGPYRAGVGRNQEMNVSWSYRIATVRGIPLKIHHSARVAAVYDDRGFVGLVGRVDIRKAELFLALSRSAAGEGTPPVTADRAQVGA